MALALIALFALVPLASCGGPLFGPETYVAQFKGKITSHGRPVHAHVSLEVFYKLNGDEIPVSLVQFDSPSKYNFVVSGFVLRNENISNNAVLRVQSLSINGGSKLVKLNLKDHQTLYENNVELGSGPVPEGPDSDLEEQQRRHLRIKEFKLDLELRSLERQHSKLLHKERLLKQKIRHLSLRIESLRNELKEIRKQLSAIKPRVPVGVEVRKTTKRPHPVPSHKPVYFGLDD